MNILFRIIFIQKRLDGLTDEKKKVNAASKISDRLGDEEYWIEFAKNLDL